MPLRKLAPSLAVCVAVLGVASSAQAPKPSPSTPQPRQAAKPAPKAAVPEIQSIINRLLVKGIGKGKGDFETTEEYDKRRSELLSSIGPKHSFRLRDAAPSSAW